jgi:phage gp46-like protein
MKDIALVTDDKGTNDVTIPSEGVSGFADSLYNNIYLSLHVKKGTLFTNPEFGSRLHEIQKVSDISIEKIKQYSNDALKWIIAAGKSQSITVDVERSSSSKNEIKLTITVLRNNGEEFVVFTWFSVIGSTKGSW